MNSPFGNYSYYFEPAKEERKWTEYMDGTKEAKRVKKSNKLIVIAAVVAAALIAIIIGLGVAQATAPVNFPFAVFITLPAIIGLIAEALLCLAIFILRKPLSQEIEFSENNQKDMAWLFTKGDLAFLYQYVRQYRLDNLVYQNKITPAQGKQMLELLMKPAQRPALCEVEQKRTDAEQGWAKLRQEICANAEVKLEWQEAVETKVN